MNETPNGIQNLGNTCYISSVLLCIFNNSPFTNYFRLISCDESDCKLIMSLKNAFITYHKQKGVFNPIDFYKNIKLIFKQYKNNKQQDANEFLVDLLYHLHKHLPKSFEYYIHSFKHNGDKTVWGDELNIVSESVQGQYKNIIKCKKCKHEVNTHQNFYQLDLDTNKSICNWLHEFDKCVMLPDYSCDKCKSKTCYKYCKIVIYPVTFIFLIKRYGTTNNIDYELHFNHNQNTYELYAVCNHTGRMHGGHYTTFIKRWGKWFLINDETVVEKNVHFNHAYMLFYKKVF